jgi:hypothetical protein
VLDPAVVAATKASCRAAIEEHPDLQPLSRASRDGSAPIAEARALLPGVRQHGPVPQRLAALKQALGDQGVPVGGGAFERFLIVDAASNAIDRVADLPVDERVKQLFLHNFELFATARVPEPFDLGRASFVSMGQMATLSRFPAGQLDWVVSGIPRSWLLRVPWGSLPRLVASLVLELGGFGPAFFSHINPNRRNQHLLLERESLRSYHRMARSMEQQPCIRGLVTASWLHSPDTFVVSPHLAWMNQVFLEHGGHVVPLGPAQLDSGVLHRSPERQQAYDAGTFTPTEALIIWPRAAMLAWARGHHEFSEDGGVRRPAMAAQGARA